MRRISQVRFPSCLFFFRLCAVLQLLQKYGAQGIFYRFQSYSRIFARTYIRCRNAYTYRYAYHTHAHTYTHIHTYTHSLFQFSFFLYNAHSFFVPRLLQLLSSLTFSHAPSKRRNNSATSIRTSVCICVQMCVCVCMCVCFLQQDSSEKITQQKRKNEYPHVSPLYFLSSFSFLTLTQTLAYRTLYNVFTLKCTFITWCATLRGLLITSTKKRTDVYKKRTSVRERKRQISVLRSDFVH